MSDDYTTFLSEAWPDCSSCGGTGIIEGTEWPVALNWAGDVIATMKDPDRVCHCVPVIIIKAPDGT